MRNNFLLILSSALIVLLLFLLVEPLPNKYRSSLGTALGCEAGDLSGIVDYSERIAIFEGSEISVSDLALLQDQKNENVLGVAEEEKWIEVDLSEQMLRAWEGDELYLETPISSGLPHTPTPTGEFRVWIKLRATKMEGGQGAYYYYLPNVPYVMFFYNSEIPRSRGFGLHGTYWHDDFGTPRSRGCVNLPTPIAKELYHWTNPFLPEGSSVVSSDENNLGTRIIIHQ